MLQVLQTNQEQSTEHAVLPFTQSSSFSQHCTAYHNQALWLLQNPSENPAEILVFKTFCRERENRWLMKASRKSPKTLSIIQTQLLQAHPRKLSSQNTAVTLRHDPCERKLTQPHSSRKLRCCGCSSGPEPVSNVSGHSRDIISVKPGQG